jgi:hypothetical protein
MPSTSPGSFDQPPPEYVVLLDGKRFLIRLPRELPPPEPIKVILHWKPPGKIRLGLANQKRRHHFTGTRCFRSANQFNTMLMEGGG